MPTLNQITNETKALIKWGIITIVVIILLFLGIKIGGVVKEIFFPTPAPKPTVSFGKLPEIALPKNEQVYNLTYTINTLTGKLPNLPDRTTIYKMQQQKADLLAFQRAKDKADSIGFLSNPTTISEGVYQWADTDTLERKFTLNTLALEFTLDSNFYADAKILSGTNLPSENNAIILAKNFLTSLSMLTDGIDETKTKTELFSIKNYTLIPSTSLADTQAIQVNFFQKDIDEKPIFYKSPYTPNISLYVTGGDREQIVKANYFYQAVTEESATYPIKTAIQAFDELQKDQAFFASVPTNIQTVLIKNVTLGYFAPSENQEYLMPVIVFEGDNGFFAYVSAITDEWIDK